MARIRVATFNVYFFEPVAAIHRVDRSDADLELIGETIASLDADVLVLQEIMGFERIDDLLAIASAAAGRDYSVRAGNDYFLASPWNGAGNKVVVAFDSRAIDLAGFGRVPGSFTERRRPLVAVLDHAESGRRIGVVGVHLKSDDPGYDGGKSDRRHEECELIRSWVEGSSAVHEASGLALPDAWVLAGDCNAVLDNGVLNPLREVVTLHRPAPLEPEEDHWTTDLDRVVIDHVGTSDAASIRSSRPPQIVRFDSHPAVLDAYGPDVRERDWDVVTYESEHSVPRLYRVSDHRPVVAEVDF